MSVHHLLTDAVTTLLQSAGPTTPAAADAWAQASDAGASSMTFARLWAAVAALLGLVGAISGGLAMLRSARRTGNAGRQGAVVALVAGVIAVLGGALNLAVADGGPGTGNGVVGGALALVLGLVAVTLGWLVVARSRRTG